MLHVDDDINFLDLVKTFAAVSYSNLRIHSLSNPADVLQKLEERDFDVIVCDYMMPDMDGLDLLMKLKYRGISAPFIIFTGQGREEIAIRALNLGANYYLQKGDIEVSLAELNNFIVNSVRKKKTELELRESERKYQDLFNETPVGIFTCDRDGIIQSVNKATLELLGSPSKEATMTINVLTFPPMMRTGFSANLEKCMKKKQSIIGETPYTSKWGKKVLYRYKVMPLTSADQQVTGVLCVLEDMTEQIKIENALKQSERRFRELVNLLPQAVFEVDNTGKFMFINSVGLEISGYSLEDVEKGLNIMKMFIPEDNTRVMGIFQKKLDGKRAHDDEFTLIRKDGTRFPVLISSSPIIIDGQTIGLRGIAIDITERKQKEKEQREL